MSSFLSSILPATTNGGKLPYWLLFISVVSAFNSVQTYQNNTLTRRVYEGNPNEVTGLSARTFGTWTLITSIVRGYAAYHLQVAPIYELAQFTFLVAGFHFVSEWLYYGTAKLGKGLAGPLVVSSASLIWMYLQKDFYVN
ncbi:ERG28 Ergosterol biosynthetic protein 28 [Candida maltosa Xu316]|uniref:Ergosterol biosynthetic protein 28 n=1 Tax=Candida maltosa (strain Xu316) TaxID=1245528 RepID=M3K6Z4_CANMX|nr:hypothetical protein G210_5316 [Candida maltosa Xu316]